MQKSSRSAKLRLRKTVLIGIIVDLEAAIKSLATH